METEWINSAKFKESFLYKMKKEYEFKIRWNERFIKYFVSNLDTFLDKVYVRYGDDDEYKPTYLTKSVDPKFPEPWQTCLVSFADKEDYLLFMNKLNRLPYPIKKQLTFEVNESAGILDFLD
jgi:hypothetical protein